MGGGVLCLPYAFRQTGYLLGIGLLLISAWIAYTSLLFLLEAAQKTKKHSYSDLLHSVVGHKMAIALDVSLIIYGYGALVCYFIFLSSFIPDVLENYIEISPATAIVIAWMISLPLAIPEKISALRIFSPISLISLCMIAFLTVYKSVELHAKHGKVFEPYIIEPVGFLQSLNIALFAFGSHLNVLPVGGELQQPSTRRIRKVIFRVCGLLLIFYGLVAFAGYYAFGEETQQNFVAGFPAETSAKLCRIFMSASLMICLPVNSNPIAHCFVHLVGAREQSQQQPPERQPPSLEGHLLPQSSASPSSNREPFKLLRITAGITILSLACVSAIYAPGAADVISLLGGSLGTFMMIVCPCVIQWKVFPGEKQGKIYLMLIAGGFSVLGSLNLIFT
jgi:amino acid permease